MIAPQRRRNARVVGQRRAVAVPVVDLRRAALGFGWARRRRVQNGHVKEGAGAGRSVQVVDSAARNLFVVVL